MENSTAYSVLRALIALAVIAGLIGLGVYFFVGDGILDGSTPGVSETEPFTQVDGGIDPGSGLVPSSAARVTPPTFPAPTN